MEHEALIIRPETSRDHDEIADVVERAFGSPAEARLVDAIRASPEYLADLSLVAVLDDQIVGHVMISRCTVVGDTVLSDTDDSRTPDGPTSSAIMLSPLAVDPAHHGIGIGGRLVREVTGRAAAVGHSFVVLEGSPRYYARFGFGSAGDHGLRLPLPDWAPPEAAQILRLDDSPVPFGRVVYPASFDVLDAE